MENIRHLLSEDTDLRELMEIIQETEDLLDETYKAMGLQEYSTSEFARTSEVTISFADSQISTDS